MDCFEKCVIVPTLARDNVSLRNIGKGIIAEITRELEFCDSNSRVGIERVYLGVEAKETREARKYNYRF